MSSKNGTNKYDDIINMSHPISKKYPQMPVSDRAAQFSPFAALTGHEAALKEMARLTETCIELDEGIKAQLNEKLQMIRESLDKKPEVTITYFEPDKKKDGGFYVSLQGKVKKIDGYQHEIVMDEGRKIRIEDIYEIESELFHCVEFE